MAIPTAVPSEIRAGTESKWTLDPGDDYRYADAWGLTVYFANATAAFSVVGSDNGDGTFLFTITAPVSTAYEAGDYTWSALAIKATRKVELDSGTVTVLPGLTAAVDGRSLAKKMLDLFEAALLAKMSNRPDVASYAMPGGRSLQAWTWEDLRAETDLWRARYLSELEAERIARGMSSGRTVLTRMD